MKHGRHLAGIGLERLGNGKDVRLLAKAPPSVVEEYGFRSVKKCALAEGQLASIALSDESVDSTSLHELLSITNKIQTIGPEAKYNLFRAS